MFILYSVSQVMRTFW